MKVSRRVFNGTVLTALLPGNYSIGTQVTAKTIPWELFCDSNDLVGTRYEVYTKPHVRDGVKFATNRRVMVWATTDENNSDTENELLDGPMRLIQDGLLPGVGDWEQWPDQQYLFHKSDQFRNECLHCFQGHVDSICCPNCDPEEGEFDPEKFFHQGQYCGPLCTVCQNAGEVPIGQVCQHCHGEYRGPMANHLVVGDAVLSSVYDQKIRQLDGPIEWKLASCPVAYPESVKDRSILFRFATGIGVVCPLLMSSDDLSPSP